MRGVLFLSLLLSAPTLAAEPLPDAQGPRVTIQAEGQPLEAILTDLAKQLNRRFMGYVTDRAPSMREPETLVLENATIPELRAALWDLTGATLLRASRTNWALNIARDMPAEPLSQPVDDWRVRLDWLRYYYYRYTWPADPASDQMVSMLTPSFTFEAIDGVRALRLLGIGESGAVTAEGESIEMRQKAPTSAGAVGADPALLSAAPTLNAPGPEVRRLANLWVDLRFAERLEVTRFVFDNLAATEQVRLRADGVTAVLAARAAEQQASSAAVTIALALPKLIDPKIDSAVLRREGWVEGRFFDAAGEPLLTETRLVTLDAKSLDEQRWLTRWQLTRSVEPWVGRSVQVKPGEQPQAGAQPARLEVTCYRPAGPQVIRRVTFEDLPLPPRERDAQ